MATREIANRVELTGVIHGGIELLAPVRRLPACEGNIKVEGEMLPWRARGDISKELAALRKGTRVHFTGKLKRYTWKTGDHKSRERIVVDVEKYEKYEEPNGICKP